MANKAKKHNKLSVQTKGTGCYAQDSFKFEPDEAVSMDCQRFTGVWTVDDNGRCECMRLPRKRSESTLLLKLPHGRLSLTKDKAVQLTLKFFDKNVKTVAPMMLAEAVEAVELLKRIKKVKL